MRKLSAFIQVSLDGYFAGPNGDIGWAHKDPQDTEWNAFVSGNASGGGALLFGRVTYEMMARFWPTLMAAQQMPEVARGMNEMPKYVVSRTMSEASWSNTTVLHGDLVVEIQRLKQSPGPDVAILGSGSLISQLAPQGMIDTLQVVINPLVLGAGQPLFKNVERQLSLKLVDTRTFGNGSILANYRPAV